MKAYGNRFTFNCPSLCFYCCLLFLFSIWQSRSLRRRALNETRYSLPSSLWRKYFFVCGVCFFNILWCVYLALSYNGCLGLINEEITQLKINNNPFAKGFRKCGQGKCKRKLRSPSPDTENCSEGPSSPKIRITDSPSRTTTPSESSVNMQMDSPAASISSSSSSSSSNRSDESQRIITEDKPVLDLAQRRSRGLQESRVSSYPAHDEGQITETSSARSTIRSPMRSPSSSSESSCHLSVSSRHEETPQSHQFADMRYLQLAEWAHYMMYSNPLWMPPGHGYPTHLQVQAHPHLWHQPSPLTPPARHTPPTPPTPPTPACRLRDQPKGSSFTIRALIGEN